MNGLVKIGEYLLEFLVVTLLVALSAATVVFFIPMMVGINGFFFVIGRGFIRLMQMLVVPLVFTSIVCGAAADILWLMFCGETGIYEIVPGFLAGLLACVLVSALAMFRD